MALQIKDGGKSLGGGKLYLKKYNDDGTLTHLADFGLTDNIVFNQKIDYIEHTNTEDREERVDLKAPKKKSASIKFKTSEITPKMVALALAGNSIEDEQASGNVSDEEHKAQNGGTYIELNKFKISNVVVKYKDGDDDVVAEEGKDYTVEATDGWIYVITGGNIDGKDTKISYDWDDVAMANIEALVNKITLVQLVFAQNPQTGNRYRYTFYKVQLAGSGDVALKDTSKFIEIDFEGEVLATDNPDKPYFEAVAI